MEPDPLAGNNLRFPTRVTPCMCQIEETKPRDSCKLSYIESVCDFFRIRTSDDSVGIAV